MRLDACTIGTVVYWPGAVWAQGAVTAFLRSGTITGTEGNLCHIEEKGTGKTFTKNRRGLYLTPSAAGRRMDALSRHNRQHNRPPRAGCQKTGYPTKRDAITALNRAQKRRLGKGALRAYACPDCRRWHLTSLPLEDAPASAPRSPRAVRAGITRDGSIVTATPS